MHCRRYRWACRCPVPATASGPPKAIGKGLLSIAFIAMLITERYMAGRSQNSLVTGLARHRAEVSPATLTKEVRGLGHVRLGVRRPAPGTHVQAAEQQAQPSILRART